MGRPPCCDKVGIKKGPWTPEEDIILVSYIQEHGPGNWRSVPTNTGLLRCSKSCRLRWTNYLRPGIKRGNFTPHEEGMIIHLQALLGNKWAAIASYLPQRTDNDIKNYWNTHLKKKLKKFQSVPQSQDSITTTTNNHQLTSMTSKTRSFSNTNERRGSSLLLDFSNSTSNTTSAALAATSNLSRLVNQGSSYASSTENIARLLEGWMRSSPKVMSSESIDQESAANHTNNRTRPKMEQDGGGGGLISNEEFLSILSFDHHQNLNNVTWDKSSTGTADSANNNNNNEEGSNKVDAMAAEKNQRSDQNPPLSFLEKWLLDESTGQVEEINQIMELSDSIF